MRVLFYISCFFVLAYAQNYETLLIEKVLLDLFKKPVKLYIADKQNDFKFSQIEVVSNCENADVVLGKGTLKKCANKPLFALSYKEFKKNANAIAAFYWRYGRPQLFLKRSGLKKFHLRIPQKYQRYLR